MNSLMHSKECKQYEETTLTNQDPFERTPSFLTISADPKSKKLDNTSTAYEDAKLHDGILDSEGKDASIFGNGIKAINSQQIVLTRIGTGTEEPTINGTNPTRTSFAQLIHEDSGIPGAASLSSHIITSSHIPYSGNLSVRSDSSTTSTHSFAFPILQPEWNNSPVKMAKADRRRSWKHRWRAAFICC